MSGPREELFRKLLSGSKKLIDSVEFDVNGKSGKGGHGGLTSNDTIRAAGELRVVISRFEKLGAE